MSTTTRTQAATSASPYWRPALLRSQDEAVQGPVAVHCPVWIVRVCQDFTAAVDGEQTTDREVVLQVRNRAGNLPRRAIGPDNLPRVVEHVTSCNCSNYDSSWA